jgi:hypothetical protein
VVEAISPRANFCISLTYQKAKNNPVTVNAVFVQYLQFANFGRLPIERADSARADPLRIEATGGNPLSLSLINSSREVCQLALTEAQHSDKMLSSRIDFDFLDHRDGGLIQIVSESPDTTASLKGTIVGMPGGIISAKPMRDKISFPSLGCVIPLILELLSLVAVPFIYRSTTGSWNNAWLLLLPIGAILLPLIVTIPLMIVLTSRQRFRFPAGLEPPSLYSSRVDMMWRVGDRHFEKGFYDKDKEIAQQKKPDVR